MPMHPSPSAETFRLLLPSVRVCMAVLLCWGRYFRPSPHQSSRRRSAWVARLIATTLSCSRSPMAKERLYKTGTTLERTLRVAYPAGRGHVVLRTELDWEKDIEP